MVEALSRMIVCECCLLCRSLLFLKRCRRLVVVVAWFREAVTCRQCRERVKSIP